MCTNYRAPEGPGFRDVHLSGLENLWRDHQWRPDIWPDYRAPAFLPDGEAVLATYGFWPSFLQPPRLDPKTGRKLRPYSTVNARSEDVGSKRLYASAWRAGDRCLIPAQYVVEPSYPDAHQDITGRWINGRNVWQKIGLGDWREFCVAGIYKRYETPEGPVIGVSMLTVNADGHSVMSRMHKPDDEKRSVVIVGPDDYDEYLHALDPERVRAMLMLWPDKDTIAEPS